MKLGNRYRTGSNTCSGIVDEKSVCDRRRIKAIVKSKDKVLVIFDDCSYMEADYAVVDDGVKMLSSAQVRQVLDELKDGIEPMKTLGGIDLASAFNVNQ